MIINAVIDMKARGFDTRLSMNNHLFCIYLPLSNYHHNNYIIQKKYYFTNLRKFDIIFATI